MVVIIECIEKKIYMTKRKQRIHFRGKKKQVHKTSSNWKFNEKNKKSNKMVLLSHWLFVMYWLNESLGFLCHFFLHNHSTPIQYSDYWIIKQPFDMIDAQPNAMNWIHFCFRFVLIENREFQLLQNSSKNYEISIEKIKIAQMNYFQKWSSMRFCMHCNDDHLWHRWCKRQLDEYFVCNRILCSHANIAL